MHSPIDACCQVAEKLKKPEDLERFIHESKKKNEQWAQNWAPVTLSNGIPGILLFYASMDQFFPEDQWHITINNYLKSLTVELKKKDSLNGSLFEGLAGLCFSVYACSKESLHFPQLLSKLDNLFCSHLDRILTELSDCNDIQTPLSPRTYNLFYGLSGNLMYLMIRKNSPIFLRYAEKCLEKIIKLLNCSVNAHGHLLPNWYISPENILDKDFIELYPLGSFNLSMLYGITGTLTALAIAANENIEVPRLRETLILLSDWLKKKEKQTPFGSSWPYVSSFEEAIGERQDELEFSRDSWCYGTPAVAYSLYLAGKALKDKSLKDFAAKKYLDFFSKPEEEWNLLGPSFAMGKAGLLAMTYRMAEHTESPELFKRVKSLEMDLLKFFDPSHPFGFQVVDFTPSDDAIWVNDPGLLNGATGIVLALALVQGRHDMKWDRIFLLG